MTAVDNRGAGLGYRDPATIVDLPLVPDSAPEAQLVIPDGNLTIKRSILPGGVRLLTQTMTGSESTAIGFWFGVGSRDESPNDAGVSHFLEHLLFKGTGELSALDIARRFDGVGADWNAATTMESTYYWSHMVETDVPTLLPTLVQMVTDAALRQRDVDIERGVILDELAMAEDSSSDVLFQNYAALLYPDASLGRPVGGTPTTVLSMGRDTIADIYRDRYRPRTLVVAVAGAVNHDQFAEMLLDALEDSPWQLNGDSPAPRRTNDLVTDLSLRDPKGGARNMVIEREVEQAHVVVGGPHLPASDPLAPVSSVLLNILGGGMSSRLFQEIRERRGLAYSAFAYSSSFTGAGSFGLYASCAPQRLQEVQKLLWGELEEMAEHGPTEEEMFRVKGQQRGELRLGLAEATARMSRLATSELRGRVISTTDSLARIDAVSPNDVQALAESMLQVPKHSAVVTARS